MKRLISIALFGLTAATLWELSRQLRRGRPGHADDDVHPVRVQTWEGEGGALPTTGAQLGPDPVVPASIVAARPSDGPGTVH
jgi:hypothetical protein